MSRLLLVLGLAALLSAGAMAMTSRPAADVGAQLTAPTDAVDPTPAPSASPTPDPTPTASPPTITTRSARLGDSPAGQPDAAAPVRIAVPAIGVDAPVGPVGVEPDGLMTVPEDVREVGWYRHGPVPGRDGSAVLAGHVDSRTQGRGVFFELGRVDVGDEVRVTDVDGTATTWVVTGRQAIDKAELPVDEVFRRDGAPRLVLVTCGGDFDAGERSYRSNVVVTAEPRP